MTNAEKENLKEVTHGMTDEEKIFSLMFYPTKYLQEELVRRENVAKEKLGALWDVMHSAKTDMTLNEMEEMFNDVVSTVRH